MESIEEGLNKTHGRTTKKNHDEEYGGPGRSLEETFDDRGTARRVLDDVHDTVTHDYSVGTALVAGATAVLEKSGQMDIESLNQVALQYPEASTAAMVAGGAAMAYEASDKFGVQASAGEAAEYVKDALAGEEGYLDLGEELGEDDRIQARDRRVGIDPESIDLEEAEELAEQIEGFEVFEDKDEVSRL